MRFLWILTAVAVIFAVVICSKILLDIKHTNEEVAKLTILQSHASDQIKKQIANGEISVKSAIDLVNRELTANIRALSGQIETGFTQTNNNLVTLRGMINNILQTQREVKTQINELKNLSRENRQLITQTQTMVSRIEQSAASIEKSADYMNENFDEIIKKQDEQFKILAERTRKKIFGLIPVGK